MIKQVLVFLTLFCAFVVSYHVVECDLKNCPSSSMSIPMFKPTLDQTFKGTAASLAKAAPIQSTNQSSLWRVAVVSAGGVLLVIGTVVGLLVIHRSRRSDSAKIEISEEDSINECKNEPPQSPLEPEENIQEWKNLMTAVYRLGWDNQNADESSKELVEMPDLIESNSRGPETPR
ncbi:hypothetical protein BY458DRAFT_553277 [Sporodiniella umbellata]|nr:hypothetical protein BY458DRAFT_553277 [Sporodiniella umbellata]